LSKSSKLIDSKKQIPVAKPNPRGLNPAIVAVPVNLPMIPIAKHANPAMMIAIAKLLMFFMPRRLLFLLLDLASLHTRRSRKKSQTAPP
jgi:hypothetical protein